MPSARRYTMGFESLIAAAQRLSTSVEALAALGAQLRLQQDRLEGNPRVRALLNEIARAVDPQLLDDVDEHQQATTLALIQTIFRQALDLLDNPARDLGWSYKDPVILQSQGQVSRLLVRGIDIMATQRHELGEMLAPPQVTRRIVQKVERLTKDCLNEGEGGRLLVLINVVEQLRVDGARDFVQESAHARVTFEPVLLQPQLRAQRR